MTGQLPHPLVRVTQEVEATHQRLGRAVAFALLCVKARKCLLLVSPAGCGKSTVTNILRNLYPDHLAPDRLSVPGLYHYQETLKGFTGLLVVDDIAKGFTPYSRLATVTALAELCYSHYIESGMANVFFKVEGFAGATVINIQPVILKSLVQADDWEACIQDKTVRYYHLYRPLNPVVSLPQVHLDWGLENWKRVAIPDNLPGMDRLIEVGATQWSRPRVFEHVPDLLKCVAALDRRNYVQPGDVDLLFSLMAPMQIERYAFDKAGLEEGRTLASDLLAIMVELASWGNPTLETISRDYRCSVDKVYKALRKYPRWFHTADKNPRRITASPELRRVLQEVKGG